MGMLLLAISFMLLSSGCTTAGDWLSGSAADREQAMPYPTQLEHVQIGVTTKDEIRNMLGNPTDIRLSSDHNQASESWANANPSINPLQYIPGFGAFAFSMKQPRSSFSISFSSDGVVDGITLRDVQPLGESWASGTGRGPMPKPYPYGKNNPLTRRHPARAPVGKADDIPVGTPSRPVSVAHP